MSTRQPPMPAGMDFAIYQDGNDFMMAMTRFAEDAAALAAYFGAGSTVQDRLCRVVWTEGKEAFAAADSYDGAAVIIIERVNARAA